MLHLSIVSHVTVPRSMRFPQLVRIYERALRSRTYPNMRLDCQLWCQDLPVCRFSD